MRTGLTISNVARNILTFSKAENPAVFRKKLLTSYEHALEIHFVHYGGIGGGELVKRGGESRR